MLYDGPLQVLGHQLGSENQGQRGVERQSERPAIVHHGELPEAEGAVVELAPQPDDPAEGVPDPRAAAPAGLCHVAADQRDHEPVGEQEDE